MAKRRKKIIAGDLILEAIYTTPEPRDGEHTRAVKSKMTTKARQSLNLKSARRKLELKISANFKPTDLHVVLTYDNQHLPKDRKSALVCIRKYIDMVRKIRKLKGVQLKYIYVTEGKHGNKRLHHHIIINATGNDLEVLQSLWTYGSVNVEYIKAGQYVDRQYIELATYLTKEENDSRPTGSQTWTSSKNLVQPIETSEYVNNNTATEFYFMIITLIICSGIYADSVSGFLGLSSEALGSSPDLYANKMC